MKDYGFVTYEGQTYKTVVIGTQTWMAENLNYNASSSRCINGSTSSEANTYSCDSYGRLYTWRTAMNGAESSNAIPSGVRGVCPIGWHIPSDAEWSILMQYVNPSCSPTGTCANAGIKLMTVYWKGTDDYGFNAKPGGRADGSYYSQGVGETGYWWSSSKYDDYKYYFRYMNGGSDVQSYYTSSVFLSVRCVKD